jgi:hypothetical protein
MILSRFSRPRKARKRHAINTHFSKFFSLSCALREFDYVVPGRAVVSNPSSCLVVALVVNFQESNLNARNRVHANVKIHGDGRSDPHFFLCGWQQVNGSLQNCLRSTRKYGNTPDQSTLTWFVATVASSCITVMRSYSPNNINIYSLRTGKTTRGCSSWRHWDLDNHMGSSNIFRIIRIDLYVDH